MPVLSLGLAKFLFDAAECTLKLLLSQFWVNVLDVFDSGEVVASAAVLRRLQCLNQNGLESSDNRGKGWSQWLFRELARVGDIIKTEPRKAIPAAREPVKCVLVESLAKIALYGTTDINNGVMV